MQQQQVQVQMQPPQGMQHVPSRPQGYIPATWLAGKWEHDRSEVGVVYHTTWMITPHGDDHFTIDFEGECCIGCVNKGGIQCRRDENAGLNAFSIPGPAIYRLLDENTFSALPGMQNVSGGPTKNQKTNQGVASDGAPIAQTMGGR
jgi:hypothetical protein